MRQVAIADEIARYVVRLVDASRPGRPGAPEFIEKWVKWGAGLRASQALVRGAKARALMHGRYHVSIKDIQALAQADPAAPHHDELLRRIRAHHVGRHRRSAARRRAGAEERDVGVAGQSARRAVQDVQKPGISRSRRRRAAWHARAQGPDDRRRFPLRAASQSVQGLQRRVRRIPSVHSRRRPFDDRLEGVRAERSLLRQEVRRGNQPQLPAAD